MKTKFNSFLYENKIASDDSPLGYYTIANALEPTILFEKLDELGILYMYDKYANFIEIIVKDMDEAQIARELILSDIFEANDIANEYLPYIDNDSLEIKLMK